MTYSIVMADSGDAVAIAGLAIALTDEIIARTGARHFDVEPAATAALCCRYLDAGIYSVVLARDTATERPLGFAALCESHALYTEGSFGIVQEFYVVPERRSNGIGAALLTRAAAIARDRGWRRLELCTPPLPAFERTLSFYQANGFEVTGGRKMKRVLA